MSDVKTGIQLVAEERARQQAKGFNGEHDAQYKNDELMLGAVCYVAYTGVRREDGDSVDPKAPQMWPWAESFWRPSTDIRNLTKAAALLTAEIDRLLVLEGMEEANGKA